MAMATATATATAMAMAKATVTRTPKVTSCLGVTLLTVHTGTARTTDITALTTLPSWRSLGLILDLGDLPHTDHMIREVRTTAPAGIKGGIPRTLSLTGPAPGTGHTATTPGTETGTPKGFQDFSPEKEG